MGAWLIPWALALFVFLPPAAAEPSLSTADPLSTHVSQQARFDLKALGQDLVQHLSGQKPASLPDLDRRLRDIEARLATGAMLESEAADIRVEVQRLSTLLNNTATLAATSGGAMTPKVQALVRNVTGTANGGGVETVALLMAGLRRVAAEPEDAAQIFDNLSRQLGDPKLSAALKAMGSGSGRDAVLAAVTGKTEPISYTDPALVKKLSDLKGEPIPAPQTSPFTHPAAVALNNRHLALEKKIIAHLTGAAASTFDGLKKELEGLKKDLGSAKELADGERAALAKLLERDERLLTGGAALARGEARLDPRLEKVLAAAAGKDRRAAAAAVDAVISQLQSVATKRDPAALNRVFDNLRASLGSDPSVAADLDAVKAEFGAKPSREAVVLPAAAKTAAAPAPAPAPAPSQDEIAAQNCQEALNGALLSGTLSGLCKKGAVGRSGAVILAGVLDTIRQQFGTVSGILTNIGFMLLGLLMGALTGGVGLIIKIIIALGMGIWALMKLVPAFVKAFKAFFDAKEGSVERYVAIRQLAALFTGVAIMIVMAIIGAKIGKMQKVQAFQAKLATVAGKFTQARHRRREIHTEAAELGFQAGRRRGACRGPGACGSSRESGGLGRRRRKGPSWRKGSRGHEGGRPCRRRGGGRRGQQGRCPGQGPPWRKGPRGHEGGRPRRRRGGGRRGQQGRCPGQGAPRRRGPDGRGRARPGPDRQTLFHAERARASGPAGEAFLFEAGAQEP
ncbi:MAG: hypothetical protein NTY77_04610 [Elusimicrobia bacterium]|nr:hypothetical protein [Elusimicrobiota bacterium]